MHTESETRKDKWLFYGLLAAITGNLYYGVTLNNPASYAVAILAAFALGDFLYMMMRDR